MNPIAESLLTELDTEARTTRRVLERVPDAKLEWRPHPKSSSLGQLALHTAKVPGALSRILSPDNFTVVPFTQADPASAAELLTALEESVAAARTFLEGLTPERANGMWRMFLGDKQIMGAPRIRMVRALMFNHWYHHRGQILVYLRLLDVSVPSVYGPTADENPFAAEPVSV
jgi:uncharacterized damage-inducible protein DinB